MARYIFAFAFILIGAAEATLTTVSSSETKSALSLQFNLDTGVLCITLNQTFQNTSCSDPERVEVLLQSIKEVNWKRNGRRTEAACNDGLEHSIDGTNRNLSISDFGIMEFDVVGSEEKMSVLFIDITWDLSQEGQAQGAEMILNIAFFSENATIIFEGQKADVFNGSMKTTIEIKSWTFCDSDDYYAENKDLGQCQESRKKDKTTDHTDLEMKFDIKKFSANDDVNAIIRCLYDKKNGFAPFCHVGDFYAVIYSEIVTVDNGTVCLPNEYPRIIDCFDPDDPVSYKQRQTKIKKDKKDKKDSEEEEEEEDPDVDLVCDNAAFIFAIPKFKVTGRYDPCEGLICSGNAFNLAFSLLMLAFFNMLFMI